VACLPYDPTLEAGWRRPVCLQIRTALEQESLPNANVHRLGEKSQCFFVAFAADAALFHVAEVSARMSLLSEAFTFFELGKTFATSGSKTTTFAPPK
jgi:hypothetical protein